MESHKRPLTQLDALETDSNKISKKIKYDRFIPSSISQLTFDLSENNKEEITKCVFDTNDRNQYNKPVINSLLFNPIDTACNNDSANIVDKENRILNFSKKISKQINSKIGLCKFEKPKPKNYSFNSKELKILDAPGLEDSFYYNLIDLSVSDLLGVSLNNHLYTYNIEETTTNYVTSLPDPDIISSIKFSSIHNEIAAIGSREGSLKLIDVLSQQTLRIYKQGTNGRICAIDWKDNLFGNGTKMGAVYLRDIRCKDQYQKAIGIHSQEVCSLKFNPFNSNYMITGGNDDTIITYDLRMMKIMNKVTAHKAAVKALSWSNTKENVFISGGGSGDRKICVWDINNNKLINQKKIGSQICNLGFTCDGFIAASFGSPSTNLCLLNPIDMNTVMEFKGHNSRVLYMTINCKGNLIVSGSSDETLRFWNVQSNETKGYLKQMSLSTVYDDNLLR